MFLGRWCRVRIRSLVFGLIVNWLYPSLRLRRGIFFVFLGMRNRNELPNYDNDTTWVLGLIFLIIAVIYGFLK